MSASGKFTSLELNFLSLAADNQGFRINADAAASIGVWLDGVYTQGTATSGTVLNKITGAYINFLANCVPAKLTPLNYRNLFTIGAGVCPGLANNKPSTYIPTYAGWGSWSNSTVDAYGNVSGPGPMSISGQGYPPKNYGVSGSYSYIYQTTGDYAWITGWPGRNSWQQSTDDFSAAYLPSPLEASLTDYDEYFSTGFVGTIARQAYYQFWYNWATRRPNQYTEFVKTLQTCYSWSTVQNRKISSYANSTTFLRGTYSNINDLTTSDVAGVNLAFKDFGNDLINLGRTIDLYTFSSFGLPSKFLHVLQTVGGLTEALKFAILYNGITPLELTDILQTGYTPSQEQEKRLYAAYLLVGGSDLEEILVVLNCATQGLISLADLLDPQKMLPNSYGSLTVPVWDTTAVQSKTYSLVYTGGGVNPDIQNWGGYLEGILPGDLPKACGAFMYSLSQVKNINLMQFEKIAQVIANLELTSKDLPLLDGGGGIPGNSAAISSAMQTNAFGSGPSGTYRFSDFFGAMSGIPYNTYWPQITAVLAGLPTQDLGNVYTKLYQKSLGNDWALLSTGSGIPSYTLYTTTGAALAGATTVNTTTGTNLVLAAGETITFSTTDSLPTPGTAYTVVSVSPTSITFSPGLVTPLPSSAYIFKYEVGYNTEVGDLIISANALITQISITNPEQVADLNWYWNVLGTQLAVEQRSLPLAVELAETIWTEVTPMDLTTFVASLPEYALDTTLGGVAQVIEAIADTSGLSGQSLVGALREARNEFRLGNAGGVLDSGLPDNVDPTAATGYAVVTGGQITGVVVTNPGNGYGLGCDCCTPDVVIYPQGGVWGGTGSGANLMAVMDTNTGAVKEVVVVNPGSGYSDTNPPPVWFGSPPTPTRLGGPIVEGSFAGSPWTGDDPVPNNLVTIQESSYTSAQAASLYS